ncbi:hypothetical protein F8388_022818 [Cannabis sativa]|uniref:Retrotransposon gag domain-containing protein n=1 Tax=Cannabis sativa TaxID=3483 RepID=A0A7J6FC20_CANSA|nr:hypothetical protein F8388_022818 [Cannabis sativa]
MSKKPEDKSTWDSTVDDEIAALKTEVLGITNAIKESITESMLEMGCPMQMMQQQFQQFLEAQDHARMVQEPVMDNHEFFKNHLKHTPTSSHQNIYAVKIVDTIMEIKKIRGSRVLEGQGIDRGQSGHNYRHEQRLKKLKVPNFDGNNPNGRVMQAERFFTCHHYDEDKKIEAAFISLSGDALLWYQYENKKRTILSWEELKRLVLKHFRGTQIRSLYDQFLLVKQEGSVGEFKKSFI